MNDDSAEQTMPDAPPPLFLQGTPSVAGTPVRRDPRQTTSTPTGIVPRRALGISAKKTPLFNRKSPT